MTTTTAPLDGPVEYDPETGTYRTRYVWESPVSLTTALVEVLAAVEDVDPRDVGRLYSAVDPEALDRLFAPVATAGTREDGRVSFVVDGNRVTVDGTGAVTVEAEP